MDCHAHQEGSLQQINTALHCKLQCRGKPNDYHCYHKPLTNIIGRRTMHSRCTADKFMQPDALQLLERVRIIETLYLWTGQDKRSKEKGDKKTILQEICCQWKICCKFSESLHISNKKKQSKQQIKSYSVFFVRIFYFEKRSMQSLPNCKPS